MAGKPIFIHIIGLEGCGHRGLTPILRRLLQNKYRNTDHRLFFREGLVRHINRIYHGGYPGFVAVWGVRYFRFRNPKSISVESQSYPIRHYRETSNQWDIDELHDLLGRYLDIRYIHLRRNIFDTVNSHPTLDGGLISHAGKLAEIDGFIQQNLAALEHRGVHVTKLDYDNITAGVDAIAAITECTPDDARAAIDHTFKKSTKDYRKLLTEAEIAEIARLFGVAIP